MVFEKKNGTKNRMRNREEWWLCEREKKASLEKIESEWKKKTVWRKAIRFSVWEFKVSEEKWNHRPPIVSNGHKEQSVAGSDLKEKFSSTSFSSGWYFKELFTENRIFFIFKPYLKPFFHLVLYFIYLSKWNWPRFVGELL